MRKESKLYSKNSRKIVYGQFVKYRKTHKGVKFEWYITNIHEPNLEIK